MGACATETPANTGGTPQERVVAAQALRYRGIGLLVSAGVLVVSLGVGLSFSLGVGSALAIAIGASVGMVGAGVNALRRSKAAMVEAFVSMEGTAVDDNNDKDNDKDNETGDPEGGPHEPLDIRHPTM